MNWIWLAMSAWLSCAGGVLAGVLIPGPRPTGYGWGVLVGVWLGLTVGLGLWLLARWPA